MKKKLVQWIVINQHPFTIVQEAAFVEFIQTLTPNAKIPTANVIKNNIMDFYLVEQEKIQEILQDTKGRISFTTDIWTSVSMKAFMVITAHYIDKEWKLQNIVIDFIQIWGTHTGENIKEIFVSSLEKFMIKTKVSLFLLIYKLLKL
jgi:hypothetical protein